MGRFRGLILQKALIIGTGGNARSVCSLLTALRKYDLLGFLELNKFNSNEFIMNFPVLGRIDFLESINKSEIHIFLAEGNNQIRKKLWEKLSSEGYVMPNLISPNSFVSDFSFLGQSNIICHNVYIGPLVNLGNNNLINTGAIIAGFPVDEIYLCKSKSTMSAEAVLKILTPKSFRNFALSTS